LWKNLYQSFALRKRNTSVLGNELNLLLFVSLRQLLALTEPYWYLMHLKLALGIAASLGSCHCPLIRQKRWSLSKKQSFTHLKLRLTFHSAYSCLFACLVTFAARYERTLSDSRTCTSGSTSSTPLARLRLFYLTPFSSAWIVQSHNENCW
jgi:hypothetical protein